MRLAESFVAETSLLRPQCDGVGFFLAEGTLVATEVIDKLFRLTAGELEVMVISRKNAGHPTRAVSVTWLPCGKVEFGKVANASDGFILGMLSKFQREAGGDIEVLHLAETRSTGNSVGVLIDSGWLKLRGNRLARFLQIEE